MSDLFHPEVPLEYIRQVFDVMAETPQHTYQVLTKRSRRLAQTAHRLDWPSNVWMGVSVENARYVFRIGHLQTVPAAVRFLSCEPLLGPLDDLDLKGIHWVIAGGRAAATRRRWLPIGCGRSVTSASTPVWPSSSSSGVGGPRRLTGGSWTGFCMTRCPRSRWPKSRWRAVGVLDTLQARTAPALSRHVTTTTKKLSTKRVYLDLFGGEPENVDRDTLLPIDGSARIALNTDDPPFTHLRFFELEPKATKLRQALSREFPGRDWLVYPGDSNDTIHQALADLRAADAGWAPTFAFIDPNGPHYTWHTLQVLAGHKGPKAKTKVELWMLFPDPLFVRLLPRTGEVRPADNAAITAMFGDPLWHAIWQAKLDDAIEPAEARVEYVNLMRWRLEQVLGYHWTDPLEIRTRVTCPFYT